MADLENSSEAKDLVGYLTAAQNDIYPKIIGYVRSAQDDYPAITGYLSIPTHYGDKYTGSYEIIPTAGFQLVNTEEKYMEEDIIVHPIPYAEVSNFSGGYTATIGG